MCDSPAVTRPPLSIDSKVRGTVSTVSSVHVLQEIAVHIAAVSGHRRTTALQAVFQAKAHFNSVNTLQRACEAAARHGQIAVLQWLTALLHAVNDTSNNNSTNTSSSCSCSTSHQQQQQAAAAAGAVPLTAVATATSSTSTSSSATLHSPGSRAPPAPGTAEAFTENRLADTDNSSSDSSGISSGTSSVGSAAAAAAAVRTAMMDKAAASGQLSTLQWIAANMSGESCSSVGMDAAAKNGHLQVLQWAHEYAGCDITLVGTPAAPSTPEIAARKGHLNVRVTAQVDRTRVDVPWDCADYVKAKEGLLLQQDEDDSYSWRCLDGAAANGHLHVLRCVCEVRILEVALAEVSTCLNSAVLHHNCSVASCYIRRSNTAV
eukprot:10844-Heterococcus_DN1.PRE.2